MAGKAGQIIPRGERIWLVRVFMGRDPESGKRKYLNKTVHGTLRDAQAYLSRTQRDWDLGVFFEPSRMSLDGHLDKWLETADQSSGESDGSARILALAAGPVLAGKSPLFLAAVTAAGSKCSGNAPGCYARPTPAARGLSPADRAPATWRAWWRHRFPDCFGRARRCTER